MEAEAEGGWFFYFVMRSRTPPAVAGSVSLRSRQHAKRGCPRVLQAVYDCEST